MIVIDPGSNGGIVLGLYGQQPVAARMPDTEEKIALWLCPSAQPAGKLYIEEMVKYAGKPQAASSAIVYGRNCGYCRGAARAYGYEIIEVPPKKWQKALNLGGRKDHPDWKNFLKAEAQKLFPDIKVTLATADAILIYEGARRGLLD